MRRWSGRGCGRQARAAVIAALLLPWTQGAPGQDAKPAPKSRIFSSDYGFVEMSGEELYVNVCRGCHMADAMGATGAGSFPSLANNPKLKEGGYVVDLVVNGRRAMPSFADMMSDGQIAAVVNYLRTHFGNDYQDVVTAADVQAARR
jgi:mono/diheme cytochrome c family protein